VTRESCADGDHPIVTYKSEPVDNWREVSDKEEHAGRIATSEPATN
jgi:hypothetical protein